MARKDKSCLGSCLEEAAVRIDMWSLPSLLPGVATSAGRTSLGIASGDQGLGMLLSLRAGLGLCKSPCAQEWRGGQSALLCRCGWYVQALVRCLRLGVGGRLPCLSKNGNASFVVQGRSSASAYVSEASLVRRGWLSERPRKVGKCGLDIGLTAMWGKRRLTRFLPERTLCAVSSAGVLVFSGTGRLPCEATMEHWFVLFQV